MGGMPIVTLEEAAMTRLEASAWPLAGGSACVFALAVVLDRLPWQATFVAVVLAVVVWAWLSPLVAGAAIGGIAWLCVTGFDVHRFGDIRITGSDDAVRAAVLVLAGVLAALVHAMAEGRRTHHRADPVWVDFYAAGPDHTAEVEVARFERLMATQHGPERSSTARAATSAHSTEEPSDG